MRQTTLLLDFDGVLNNEVFLRAQRDQASPRLFDPANVASLNALCDALSIRHLVISSTWREGRTLAQLQALLHDHGVSLGREVCGTTGTTQGVGAAGRAREITTWIAVHKPEHAIVLDDYDVHNAGGPRVDVFKIDPWLGLTLPVVADIIAHVGAAQADV